MYMRNENDEELETSQQLLNRPQKGEITLLMVEISEKVGAANED